MANLFEKSSENDEAPQGGLLTVVEAANRTGKPEELIRDYLLRGRVAPRDAQGKKLEGMPATGGFVQEKELLRFLDLVQQDVEKYQAEGLNSDLGFFDVPEWERTKHVHRLHPYLGKFIPQLVEYFLSRFFEPGQRVLDPFMGSGTTLVQANELNLHSAGFDVSEFNCKIVSVKTKKYDLDAVGLEVGEAFERVAAFSRERFEDSGGLFQDSLPEFETESGYLNTWFAPRSLQEILFYRSIIPEFEHQDLLRVVLSRAARSARLIPHYDQATPKEPIREPDYCYKHKRTCDPIGECLKFLRRYSEDTVRRLREFDALRTGREIQIIHGDSRKIALEGPVHGVFTSPPYLGQIDYHQQHTYAYELFEIPRRDEQEIGPKSSGKSKKAREGYVEGIAGVLQNVNQFIQPGGPIFIVANDRLELYPEIAERSGLRIEDVQKRAVSKRTERDNRPYSESIFLMRGS